MITICHFSDWHAIPYLLPDNIDLFICTGDMYPNSRMDPIPDPVEEEEYQKKWAKQQHSVFERCLPNKDAPIIICRGNHDFTSLKHMFPNRNTIEIGKSNEPTVFMWKGLSISGTRGVDKYIGWQDEITDEEFQQRVDNIPKFIDILVTHTPPYGILDWTFNKDRHIGSHAVLNFTKTAPNLKLHCFGHAHEQETHFYDTITYSNAARGTNAKSSHPAYNLINL